MTFFNTIKNILLNVIFPINCVGCKKAGLYFCVECLSKSPVAERESDEWIFPIFDYRHPPIRRALSLLKYKNKRGIAKDFAPVLFGKISEELSDMAQMKNFYDPILIPIPLSNKRYRERGYNQAELICREIEKLDKNNNFKLETKILIKPKETEHQARIKNRSERLKNITGSFGINTTNIELIKNKNIILIDDILTTGATLTEAKKVLKKSGARKVIAFTLAH